MRPGDTVRDTASNLESTVLRLYDDFSAASRDALDYTTPKGWLSRQVVPYSQANLEEMWAKIRRNGSTTIRPLSQLEPLR